MSTSPPRKMRVYVAGPYTKPDPVENTNRAIKVCTELLDAGYAPFCPHLSLAWHLVTPRPYETWLEYDFQWIRACDVLYRLRGESKGADREEEFAKSLGIPVVYDLAALAAYRDGRASQLKTSLAFMDQAFPMGTPSER